MSTLQNFCIRVIVTDFERYYWAFTKCDNIVEQRKFHFLQRVYSDKIVHLLNKEGSVPERYVDFLVNKYTTYLDTDYFQECSWEKVTAKFAEIGSNLKEIHFRDFYKIPWQDVICNLTNLERVNILHYCTDDILKCIAKFCPNIVAIDVTNSANVTDKGMKYLCVVENGVISCPKLEELWIKSSGVTIEGVVHLVKNLRSLETIDHFYLNQALYSLHKNDLSALHKIEPYKFTSLSSMSNVRIESHYNDILHICLSLCPRLKSLHCSISRETFDFFPCLHELEKLELECYFHRDVDLNNILKLQTRKLTDLTVCYGSLSVSTLAESCPSLRNLDLDEVILQNNSGIPPIFQQLTSCHFSHYHGSAAARPISLLLGSSPALKELSFLCSLLSSELKAGILICCKYSPIERITFDLCTFEIDFVKDILWNCRSLTCCTFMCCDLDSELEIELQSFAEELPNVPVIVVNS